MKKYLLLILISFFGFSAVQAQEYNFGIKGGVNYAMGAEITGKASTVNGVDMYNTDTYTPESKLGFHGGIFFELRLDRFFVRPEAMYNTVETEFTFVNISSIYSVETLSIPLLLGYNIYGPFDVYAGPVYQKILETSLENTRNVIVVQNSPLAAQLGVKARLGRFEVDLRYDRSLASEEIYEINIQGDSTPSGGGGHQQDGVNRADFDGRIHQVLLSVSFKIFDSDSSNRPRRSRGGCYF